MRSPFENPKDRSSARLLIGSRGRVQQDVALDTDLLDQVKLALDEIHMLLLAFQDVQQQIPRYEVANTFAMGDGLTQIVKRLLLEQQIGTKDFLDGLADRDLIQSLHIGQAIEEQYALDRSQRVSCRR